MQRVSITGTLGADPEVTQVGETSVTGFSVACNERWTKDGEKQERTEWFKCSAWGKMGETIAKYAKKGQEISIEGKMKTHEYMKDDQKHSSTDLIVDNFEFRRSTQEPALPGLDDLPF